MSSQANIYANSEKNTTLEFSDASRENIAVCFSGGGSRSMTCTWGQLLGLEHLNLMSKVRYISSVSGGTWASSVYTYLPKDISDSDLLGSYVPPAKVALDSNFGHFDVSRLHGKYSMGQAPDSMNLIRLFVEITKFLVKNKGNLENLQWLWASLVAQHILEPFGLRKKGNKQWDSSMNFSLSLDYAKKNFPQSDLSLDEFFFVREGRPFLIMNNNILCDVEKSLVQLPNQVTPVSGGVKGETPHGHIVGGGTAQSYALGSKLLSRTNTLADISISQKYSLIDIVSTSSAFFAQYLAQKAKEYYLSDEDCSGMLKEIEEDLSEDEKKILIESVGLEKNNLNDCIDSQLKDLFDLDEFIDDIVPKYNYWNVTDPQVQGVFQYTDGGTLENTGILGVLAQTQKEESPTEELKILSFINGSTPLQKKKGKIIAGGQTAAMFGLKYDFETGDSRLFTAEEKDPSNQAFDATSLIQIFSNEKNEFETLVQGLYDSNCNGSVENKRPAFCEMNLVTVENSLANIKAGRLVNVLFVQNAKMLDWQNAIQDEELCQEIEAGQDPMANTFQYFKNFPYFSTGTKVHLYPRESNCLSQMWAWAVCDEKSPLKQAIETFMGKA